MYTLAGMLAGCAAPLIEQGAKFSASTLNDSGQQLALINRITWGVNDSTARAVAAIGFETWLERQLNPQPPTLPDVVQAQIDALTINKTNILTLTRDLDERRKNAAALRDDAQKSASLQGYQRELTQLAAEAATREMLRAVYSPNQLHEHMVWFWSNHFSVFQNKLNLRALVGDYQESAIRPHALGKFRDLLGATTRHAAMLRYLDNEQNAARRINENHARELMELHTLGVNGGYSQRDVQELARILTGVGVRLGALPVPRLRPQIQSLYVRDGLFEFNPARHDFGDKEFLGQVVRGRGLEELDEALDRLARHPATARFISHKLALFFVSDEPDAALVDRLAATFTQTDGDIAALLRVLFTAPQMRAALGSKFKDPMHYVVSAMRLAYDTRPILNARPMIVWLNRMGQLPFGRETPDGYALTGSAWASPGQMTTRFEIAKLIGAGLPGLFRTDDIEQAREPEAPPLFASPFFYASLQDTLAPSTRNALARAANAREWNTFFLSSPEMMKR